MFRKLIKKLNNFRLTAIIMLCVSGVAALYSLGSFFLYHFAGDLDALSEGAFRNVGFTNTEKGPYVGMVLFFMAIISFFTCVFICYSLVPFIKNKEKLTPKKGLLLAGFVSAFFEIALIVLMIVLLATNPPHSDPSHYAAWKALLIVSLPLGFASAIGSLLYLVPFLKCDFYMPQIKRD